MSGAFFSISLHESRSQGDKLKVKFETGSKTKSGKIIRKSCKTSGLIFLLFIASHVRSKTGFQGEIIEKLVETLETSF